MTISPDIFVRQKIIETMKGSVPLTALVPASRIYPQKTPPSPSWPFIRMGALADSTIRTDCGVGGEVSGAVHCFTKASASTLDPEAAAANIKRRIASALDAISAMAVTIDGEAHQLDVQVTGGQLLVDPEEADAFHGIVEFEATII